MKQKKSATEKYRKQKEYENASRYGVFIKGCTESDRTYRFPCKLYMENGMGFSEKKLYGGSYRKVYSEIQ